MNAIRQKPANEQAVKKLEGFIWSLKLDLDAGEPANFSSRQKKFFVSNSTTAALKALGVIEKAGNKFAFKSTDRPRTIALLVLNYFLTQNKKTMRGDSVPEFAALTNTLNNILEKFNLLIVQNEVGLKRLKTTSPGTADSSDLFKIGDERVYIAGQIASGIYPKDGASVQDTNRLIVEATDDLLLQLRGKKNYILK